MNPIYFYNTLTKKKDKLVPINGKKVLVYSCGPTLYYAPHIGNMRCYVFADTLRRSLSKFNYDPKYAINLTDVGHLTDDSDDGEDKIEKVAKEKNKNALEIINEAGKLFFTYLDQMNIPRSRFFFPKATEHIEEQINLIKRIEEKGYAYEIDDGIYFDTSKFKKYGMLGNFSEADLIEGKRVKQNHSKKNMSDFALWKKSSSKRQQEWDSPWGVGFPGWHLECSAMVMKVLGEEIDIHTGGIDHISIHHNNEIAQSESVTKKKFANIWMHVSFVNLNDEKISKSLGNIYTLTDLSNMGFNPLSLRYLFLLNHYRTPLSFSFESMRAAEVGYTRLREEISNLKTKWFSKVDEKTSKKVIEAISDDLNTSKTLAVLREMLKDDSIPENVKFKTAKWIDEFLGLKLTEKLERKLEITEEENNLIEKLKKARKDKNYKESDMLRSKLRSMGYDVNYVGDEVVLHKKL